MRLLAVFVLTTIIVAAESPPEGGGVPELERWLDSRNELDLSTFKLTWQRIAEEYTGPQGDPTDRVFRERIYAMQAKAQDLLTERFIDVVEDRNLDEAIEILTYWGFSKIQARLASVLMEVDDLEFVASIVHAELSPEKWSNEAMNNHLHSSALKEAGPINELYCKLIDDEPRPENRIPGSVRDKDFRALRKKLEDKYPFLAEGAAGERPAPPMTTTKDPQRSPPDAPRTRPSEPSGESPDQESRSFPVVPVVAGGALIVLLIAWLIGRASRRR